MRQKFPSLKIYFRSGYLNGELFVGNEYIRLLDTEFQLVVLEHKGTGIRVWDHALDLRSAAPESPRLGPRTSFEKRKEE